MARNRGRALAVTFLAIGASALVPASTAQAHGSLAVGCRFHGFASPTPPIPYVGGSGTFTFVATAECVEHHKDRAAQRSVTLTEHASYTSVVCGTGSATSTASLKDHRVSLGSARIDVTFTAFAGVISGTFVGAGPWRHHSGEVHGGIEVGPGPDNQPGAPPDGVCATQFESSGAFTLADGGRRPVKGL